MVSPKHEAFLDLEDTLTRKLSRSWDRAAAPVFKRIKKFLNAGKYYDAHNEIDKLDLGPVFKRHKKLARTVGKAALLLGHSRLTDPRKAKLDDVQLAALDTAMAQLETLMSKEGTQTVRQRAHDKVEKLRRDTTVPIGKAASPAIPVIVGVGGIDSDSRYRDAVNGLVDAVGGAGAGFAGLASSLHVSRMNTFGFLSEAIDQNLTHYKVNEVLDSRTCEVCKVMDGKVFTVQQGITAANGIMEHDDPDSLPVIAPWPSQKKSNVNKLKTMSADDLDARGLTFPPFHPWCRGIITQTDETETSPPQKDIRDMTPAEQAEVYAGKIKDRAEEVEASIRKDLAASRGDAQFLGLAYVLKGEGSLARKIVSNAVDDGLSIAEASKTIKDSVRYTLEADLKSYSDTVDSTLRAMVGKGYEVVKFKNYWGKPGEETPIYQGVNVNLRTPEGDVIELQFHTKDSFHVKQHVNHSFYEEFRSDDVAKDRADELFVLMQNNQATVEVPPGIHTFTGSTPALEYFSSETAVALTIEEQSKQLAASIYDKAAVIEPAITAAIAKAKGTATFKGLKYKLKGVDSLSRKIRDDSIDDNVPLEVAAGDVKDSVRYTLLANEDDYAGSIDSTLLSLVEQGYEVHKYKNYWKKPGGEVPIYQGVNVNLKTPNGDIFELQFHTEQSFHIKQDVNHEWYEEYRTKGIEEWREDELTELMQGTQSTVPVPYEVHSVAGAGYLATDPLKYFNSGGNLDEELSIPTLVEKFKKPTRERKGKTFRFKTTHEFVSSAFEHLDYEKDPVMFTTALSSMNQVTTSVNRRLGLHHGSVQLRENRYFPYINMHNYAPNSEDAVIVGHRNDFEAGPASHSVFRHELGHHIDFTLANFEQKPSKTKSITEFDAGDEFSHYIAASAEYRDAMRDEVAELYSNMGEVGTEYDPPRSKSYEEGKLAMQNLLDSDPQKHRAITTERLKKADIDIEEVRESGWFREAFNRGNTSEALKEELFMSAMGEISVAVEQRNVVDMLNQMSWSAGPFRAVSKELHQQFKYALNDYFGSMSQYIEEGPNTVGTGHETSYYDRSSYSGATEAFANYVDIRANPHPLPYKLLKYFTPRTDAGFDSMLERYTALDPEMELDLMYERMTKINGRITE